MYQADAAISRLFRQPNPAVAQGTNENSRLVLELGDFVTPKVAQENNNQEPSFLDHFSNFFARIAKAVENRSICSKFNSRAKNATNEFFNAIKFYSKNDAVNSANKFNEIFTEIDNEVAALDGDVAEEIKKTVQKSIEKSTSEFTYRLIYKDDYDVEEWRASILQEVCAQSKSTDKNSGNKAGEIASYILRRKQYADECSKICCQIKTLVPDNWVDAVYEIKTDRHVRWDQATSSLIQKLKENIIKALPGKSEEYIVNFLNSDWSRFERQFGDQEPYHPRCPGRNWCKSSVKSYRKENKSALDLKICEFILSNLNYTSVL